MMLELYRMVREKLTPRINSRSPVNCIRGQILCLVTNCLRFCIQPVMRVFIVNDKNARFIHYLFIFYLLSGLK